MPSLTLSVPEDMLRKMREHPDVKWTEVARMAFTERLRDLEAPGRSIKMRGVPMFGRRLSNKIFEVRKGPRAPLKELGLE